LALLLGAPVAMAQGVSPGTPAAAEKSYDEAFRAMLAEPANLDKTFAYAQAAIAVGDLEGAISALERMLFVNPELPRVRLELGVLYFRLGSYAAARNYFNSVLDLPSAPQEVRDRVAGFIAEIDKRESRHHLSGSLFAGIRRQSNANTASATGNVLIQGINANLDSQFTSKRDDNAFVALGLKHLYDLDPAANEKWETNLVTYAARQAAQKQVDVALAEINSGPAFKPIFGADYDLELRPYAIFTYVAVGDARDYFAPGVGGALGATLTSRLLLELSTEWRDRRFRDSFKTPNKTDRDGIEATQRGRLVYAVDNGFSVNLGAGMTVQNTDDEPSANTEYSLTAGFAWNHPMPMLPVPTGAWTMVASATRAYTKYDAPDPTISADDIRQDRDWRFSLTEAVPLTDTLTLVATLARTIRGSTLPNFEYRNDSATIGLNLRF
jgi:hypothetical protein